MSVNIDKNELLINNMSDGIFNMKIDNNKNIIINKGTGAGGVNTTYYGKRFEDKTNNENRLINAGYIKYRININKKNKYNYYYSKKYDDKTIIYLLQDGLKSYIYYKYNIELYRNPDEAYIIEYNNGNIVVKILEKKEQHVEGSIETKLWSGNSLKREYEIILGDKFKVEYAFCINEFLGNKIKSNINKYKILNIILLESNIKVLFGDDENYFTYLDNWIYDIKI